MLQLINQKLKGCLYWIIIITIPIMLLTSIHYLFILNVDDDSLDSQTVIKVGNINISKEVYQNALKNNLSYNANDLETSKKIILEELTAHELLKQDAQNSHVYITPLMLVESIFSNSNFHENGKYSESRFNKIAKYNGGPTVIKSFFVNNMLASSIINVLKQSQFILNNERKKIKDLSSELREIKYYSFNINDYKSKIYIDDNILKNYYNKNKQKFCIPEQVVISYTRIYAKNFIDNTHFDRIINNNIKNSTFNELIKKYKLKIYTSKPISRGEKYNTKITNNIKELQQEIFENHKTEGIIYENKNQGFIYFVDQIIPSRILRFFEIKDKIKQIYLDEESEKISKNNAKNILKILKLDQKPPSSLLLKYLKISKSDINTTLKYKVFNSNLNEYYMFKYNNNYLVFKVTNIITEQKNLSNLMIDTLYNYIEISDYINSLQQNNSVKINYKIINE